MGVSKKHPFLQVIGDLRPHFICGAPCMARNSAAEVRNKKLNAQHIFLGNYFQLECNM